MTTKRGDNGEKGTEGETTEDALNPPAKDAKEPISEAINDDDDDDDAVYDDDEDSESQLLDVGTDLGGDGDDDDDDADDDDFCIQVISRQLEKGISFREPASQGEKSSGNH
ncbi:prothymosin alpha-B-like [Cynara cardunculus var. scolymus]|uniref:prothymosin alpha-B-like n=1 Tax=Cynara cardunculus var. scolymus TaxID=59895 RepID=UPI000D62F9C9|nr:prothymosin alpha-B-like [Cynara cardunculus var. scolymus]